MRGAGFSGDAPVVFVSYSREDAEWRRRFVEMLKPVVRERRLEVWSDERNVVGEQWRPQLAAAIERSRAALLLVSGPFLASDFIMQQELPALLKRGTRLVCVLVRPCLWVRSFGYASGCLSCCRRRKAANGRGCRRAMTVVRVVALRQ